MKKERVKRFERDVSIISIMFFAGVVFSSIVVDNAILLWIGSCGVLIVSIPLLINPNKMCVVRKDSKQEE